MTGQEGSPAKQEGLPRILCPACTYLVRYPMLRRDYSRWRPSLLRQEFPGWRPRTPSGPARPARGLPPTRLELVPPDCPRGGGCLNVHDDIPISLRATPAKSIPGPTAGGTYIRTARPTTYWPKYVRG